MIEVKNIHKSFGEKQILKDVSLSLNVGDKLAVIGQSGVGKSVLLKHLNGLLKHDRGNVFVNNIKINKVKYDQLRSIRRDMSMVFQFGALLDSLTIKENVALAFYSNDKYDSKEIYEKVDYSLNLVGLPVLGI